MSTKVNVGEGAVVNFSDAFRLVQADPHKDFSLRVMIDLGDTVTVSKDVPLPSGMQQQGQSLVIEADTLQQVENTLSENVKLVFSDQKSTLVLSARYVKDACESSVASAQVEYDSSCQSTAVLTIEPHQSNCNPGLDCLGDTLLKNSHLSNDGKQYTLSLTMTSGNQWKGLPVEQGRVIVKQSQPQTVELHGLATDLDQFMQTAQFGYLTKEQNMLVNVILRQEGCEDPAQETQLKVTMRPFLSQERAQRGVSGLKSEGFFNQHPQGALRHRQPVQPGGTMGMGR